MKYYDHKTNNNIIIKRKVYAYQRNKYCIVSLTPLYFGWLWVKLVFNNEPNYEKGQETMKR